MKKYANKVSKPLVSIATSLALLTSAPTVSFANFWDSSGYVYTNVTKGTSTTEPLSGVKFYSTNSIEVRFKATTTYTPLFSFGSPKLKVDCRGISFNGGFASLINIEQLGQQLEDAGASLAWGVMIGLAYSLPALKQVFDEINKWANWLSKILADACNAGQIIGKGLGKEIFSDLDDAISGVADTAKNVTTTLNSIDPIQKLTEFVNDSTLTEADKTKIPLALVERILAASEKGVMATYLSSLNKSNAETGIPFSDIPSGKYFSMQKVELDDMNLSDSSLITTFMIDSLLTGDIGLTDKSEDLLIELSNLSTNIDDKFKKFLKDVKSAYDADGAKFADSVSSDRKNVDPEAIIEFLFNGGDNAAYLSGLKAPTFYTFKHKVIGSANEQKIIALSAEGSSSDASTYAEVFANWKGLEYASKAAIAKVINSKILAFSNDTTTENPISEANSAPIMDPNMFDLFRNYILFKGKDTFSSASLAEIPDENKPEISIPADPDLEALANRVGLINAYMMANDIVKALSHAINSTNFSDSFKLKNEKQDGNSELQPQTKQSTKDNSNDARVKLTEHLRVQVDRLKAKIKEEFKFNLTDDYIQNYNNQLQERIDKKINKVGKQ